MSIDFSKHTTGDTVRAHVCRSCGHKSGINLLTLSGYRKEPYLCDVCGHFGDGATMACLIVDWLILTPVGGADL